MILFFNLNFKFLINFIFLLPSIPNLNVFHFSIKIESCYFLEVFYLLYLKSSFFIVKLSCQCLANLIIIINIPHSILRVKIILKKKREKFQVNYAI